MLSTAHSGTEPPLVSIIMPTDDNARHVREALKSVAAQTYANIELILIDEGSKDQTEQIIKQTITELDREMRIAFRSQESEGTRGGAALTRETAAALARKHADVAAFHRFRSDFQRNPFIAVRHHAAIDMLFQMLARRVFTNRGIQGETLLAAVLDLVMLMAGRANATIRVRLLRLVGFRLVRRCKVRGRLRSNGNLAT